PGLGAGPIALRRSGVTHVRLLVRAYRIRRVRGAHLQVHTFALGVGQVQLPRRVVTVSVVDGRSAAADPEFGDRRTVIVVPVVDLQNLAIRLERSGKVLPGRV